jgi:hypothetical protein
VGRGGRFSGFENVWQEFDELWLKRLKQEGLPYFHAGDFSHFSGAFKTGWKDDEPRRQKLFEDLMGIIQSCNLRKFGTIIPVKAHRTIDEALRKRLFLDAYVQGARTTVATFDNHARSLKVYPRVRYVFEKGDSEDLVRKRFSDDCLNEPTFTWKTEHLDRKGVLREEFVGLQAAGWIAYEYFLDLKRRNDSYARTKEARWAHEQFDRRVPGQIEIQTEESARGNEVRLRVSEATRYLGEIKPKP